MAYLLLQLQSGVEMDHYLQLKSYTQSLKSHIANMTPILEKENIVFSGAYKLHMPWLLLSSETISLALVVGHGCYQLVRPKNLDYGDVLVNEECTG